MHIRKLLIWFLTVVLVISCCCPIALATENPDADQPATQSDGASWWEKVKDKAGDIADTVIEKAPGVIESAKEGASNLYDSAKEKVPEWIDKAKDGLNSAGEAVSDFRESQEDQFWNWFEHQTNGAGSNNNAPVSPDMDESPAENSTANPAEDPADSPGDNADTSTTEPDADSNSTPNQNTTTDATDTPDASTNTDTATEPPVDANTDADTDSSVNAATPTETQPGTTSPIEDPAELKEAPLWLQILWISPIVCLAGSCIFCGYTLYRMQHPRTNNQPEPDHPDDEDDHKKPPVGRYVKPKR